MSLDKFQITEPEIIAIEQPINSISLSLRLNKTIFGILSHISPRITTKLLLKQFYKPSRKKQIVRFSQEEVKHVADVLEKEYGIPDLYLNHCTDNLPIPFVKKTPITKILKKRFGEEKLKNLLYRK